MSQQPTKTPQIETIPWMLWGALLVSTLFFAGLLASNQPEGPPVELLQAAQNPAFFPLAMIAFSSLVISYFLPNIVLKGRLRQVLNQPGLPQGAGAAQIQSWHDAQVMAVYLSGYILQLALRESVAVMGFLIGTVTHSQQAGLLFIGLGAVGIATNRPNIRLWRDRLQALA